MKPLSGRRLAATLSLLFVLLVAIDLGACLVGSSPLDLLRALGLKEAAGELNPDRTILFGVRLPRVILSTLIGAALAMSGAVFQALLRNPLADPYILGVSGGAAVGAVAAIGIGLQFTFLGLSATPILAFLGALLSLGLVYLIARSDGHIPVYTLILSGVIVNAFFTAIIMFLTSIVDFTRVPGIVFWLMGSINPRAYEVLLSLFVYTLIGGVCLFWIARDLNLMTLGDRSARHLGVPVERVKVMALVAASLITGAAVSQSGLIGFVGLLVPHAVRLTTGPDHRLLIPASALVGGAFLTLADTLARTVIAPTEIPVGVITALCGGPFFVIILKKRQKVTMFE